MIGSMNYIEVIDFTNPRGPKAVREGVGCAPFWYQGNRALCVQGHLLYAAAGEAGFYVYDWASGEECEILGQFGFWGSGATRASRIEYVKTFGIAKTDAEAAEARRGQPPNSRPTRS